MNEEKPHSEKEPLLGTSTKKVTINVPEEEGISQDVRISVSNPAVKVTTDITKKEPSYKAGIASMLFITFLSSICFSIILPSITAYLKDEFDAKNLVGWAVAVNSVGSFVASPLFGWWAEKRSTREVLVITLCVMIAGNLAYSLATNQWMLLAGRFVVGIASANYAVAQTYISYATTPENRTTVMGLNSAANVLGFIIGPAFALVLTFFHFNVAGVQVNDYTSPGYLSAILCIVGMLSLIPLKEISASTRKKKTRNIGSSTYGSGFYSGQGSIKDVSQILKMRNQNLPKWPIVVSLIAYFCYTASFTVFETIGSSYTRHFGWGVGDNSILYAALGGVCIVSLMILQIFIRFFDDRTVILGCTLLSVGGFLLLVNFQGHQYVSFAQFSVGVTLCSGGYSTAVAVLISIYSKVLEGLDQGALMGWLSSSGSIARIIGPLIASYTFQYGGPRLVFLLMVGICGFTFAMLAMSYVKLAPRVIKTKNIQGANTPQNPNQTN